MMKQFNTTFGIKNILASYIDFRSKGALKSNFRIIEQLREEGGKIFLDSGAFSVWNSGRSIKLIDYITFLRKYHHYFDVITALDVMDSPRDTLLNYQDMIKYLPEIKQKIIPVYHYPEPVEYLDKYIEIADYIGIGAITGLCKSTKTLMPYLIKVLNHIPKHIKIHLFGLSRYDVVLKFGPRIASVDSTSWSASPLFLTVLTNHGKKFIDYKHKTTATRVNTMKWLCNDVAQLQDLESRLNAYIEREEKKKLLATK